MTDNNVNTVKKKQKTHQPQILTHDENDKFTRVYQFNLHKSLPCNVDLYKIMEEDKRDNMGIISFIQEPCIDVDSGVIAQFPRETLIYHREQKRKTPLRAALYYSSDLNIQPFYQFIGPDIATGVWTYKNDDTGEFQKVIVTSVYMDIDNPYVWPLKFLKLTHYCYTNKFELLIGCDSNAHSTAWGKETQTEGGSNLITY